MFGLAGLLGKASAQPIEAIGNVFDKLFTSDEEREQAKFVMAKLRQHPSELQVELNKVEAQHRSIFVAGWRPYIGWVCGTGLGYVWVLRPMIQDLATALGKVVEFAPIETANMIDLVIALLGLGALRTAEKFAGRAK